MKANHIINILDKSNINLSTIADVGCGAGVVSHFLAQRYPNFSFTGFDVSPQLLLLVRFIKASKSQLFPERLFFTSRLL